MSDPAWHPEQSDLERKLGGAMNLVALSGDSDLAGSSCVAFISACLAVGRGSVRRAVEVKHEPETIDQLDTESTISLRRFATVKAAEAAWNDGAGDLAMPEKLRDEIVATNDELSRIATGQSRLGRASNSRPAALGQPVGVVNYDPNGCKVSIAGFKRGFR